MKVTQYKITSSAKNAKLGLKLLQMRHIQLYNTNKYSGYFNILQKLVSIKLLYYRTFFVFISSTYLELRLSFLMSMQDT